MGFGKPIFSQQHAAGTPQYFFSLRCERSGGIGNWLAGSGGPRVVLVVREHGSVGR
jgi:hypothetical protein